MRHALLAAAAASLAALATPALAKWSQIGERTVSDRGDFDRIVLPGGREFRRVRFCVYRNPVEFKDVDIVFRNGGRQDVAIADEIRPGKCSRAIDLEGGSRDIESIGLRYEEGGLGRRTATVRVFAD